MCQRKKPKWKIGTYSQALSAKWGWVSYNPKTGRSLGGLLTDLANTFGGNVADGEETALYFKKENAWMILTGDFRKQYERAFPIKAKCLAVYHRNIKYRNNWSTDAYVPA